MTKRNTSSFKPIKLPAGLEPRWEQRYKGRTRWELDALQAAGISPDIDPEALKHSLLVLTFDWPIGDEVTLKLQAVYPDSFPHVRPQVFLLSGLDPPPVRHRNPGNGNLCLLGRDTRQWLPSWTLCKLLSEQLEHSIHDTGDEDPQGEPADYWWNALGPSNAYCLFDSNWDMEGAKEGTLAIRYLLEEIRREPVGLVPIIRAVVSKVFDEKNNVLHEWEAPLSPDFDAAKTMIIPWVWLDKAILPSPKVGDQVTDLKEAHTQLQKLNLIKVSTTMKIALYAIAHRCEIGFNEIGTGLVVFMEFGRAKSFMRSQKKAGKGTRSAITTLPVLRAGPGDLGHRVPAVRLLQDKRVLVVGAGAIGAPVAVELARNGCSALHLIEHDIVEPGNTVRWPLGASAWGSRKVDALNKFLNHEYPLTDVHPHPHYLGMPPPPSLIDQGDDALLNSVLPEVDMVVDGTASHGITTLLAERCRNFDLPMVSLFATPSLEGGAVVRYSGDGGCPNCLEYAWHNGEITPPPGLDNEEDLTQPPGCAERTFIGASYDLQELSLQAVRLVIETLASGVVDGSIIQTLSFINDQNSRCPPQWRVDVLPIHPDCGCRP